ncbi:MAG: T9SS type A sorting domain-containing protein [Bacteroidales bacterium]|nr:T9SS type A sorting domain-containing protein [Bacteroidales bacterium]
MRKTLSPLPGPYSIILILTLLISIRAYPLVHPGISLPGHIFSSITDLADIDAAPVLSGIEKTPLSYSLGAGPVIITNTITVSDPDDTELLNATVAITAQYTSYQDILRFTNTNKITGIFNRNKGILTLTGPASVEEFQAALRSVQYDNTSYIFFSPNTNTRTVQFSISDGKTTSKPVSRDISFRPSATISGGGDLCGSWQKAGIVVELTGRAPWTITIRRSGGSLPKDTAITGIRSSPYKFAVNIDGVYTLLNVSDRQFNSGIVYGQATVTYDLKPTAVIYGIDTVCPGDEATLHVQLEGTSPFSITYLRNGSNATTINNITDTDYALKVTGDGTYTLSAVSDPVRSGCVSGTGTVIYYTVPTAVISGSASICETTPTNLRVDLTGSAPWNISYRRNMENPAVVPNVISSPKYIPVTKSGTYTLVSVSDKHCTGTVSGSATISFIPAPEVSISGLLPAYKIDTGNILVTGTPPGGTFSGHGLYTSEGRTYFFPSSAGLGVHNIVYAYQDVNTTCYGYDTVQVVVLLAEATITFPNDKKFYCFNEDPFTIRGDNIENSIGHFTISGGTGLTDNGDNTATIDPSQFTQGGEYTVYYSYYWQGDWKSVYENFEIEYVADIDFIGFDKTSYCNNEDVIDLYGSVPGGIFSGKAVYGSPGTGFHFDPTKSAPGPDTIFYTYTTPRGCVLRVYKALTILEVADINFVVNNTCIDDEEKDSTVFINLTTTPGIISWEWDFGDPSSLTDNNSTLRHPKHLYKSAGQKNVTLQATTSGNCINQRTVIFNFGDEPKADFSLKSECFHAGQPIKFVNISSIGEGVINYNMWRFYSGQTCDSSLTQNADYIYDSPGNYEVDLYVRTNYGCSDALHKTITVRPAFQLQEGASYYESFENKLTGWTSGSGLPHVNSWTLGEPVMDSLGKGFRGASSGKYAWYTDITFDPVTGRSPVEHSYVTSPCYNFSGISKPMIKLKMWKRFNKNHDGAVLQYSADSCKSWKNVGDLYDGINWYNSYSIRGNPGEYNIGWSDDPQDNNWTEARHSLDDLKGLTDVQFRIAYGSDGTDGTSGMAFDDIWIGNRSKMVLIEHFTNSSDIASRSADSILDALANSLPLDIIDIQYHTSLAGPDPFNEQNKVDPGTRVLLYQLSTVPMSILNGGAGGSSFRFDYAERLMDTTRVKNQSLLDPKFSIDLLNTFLDNALSVEAELRALDTIENRQLTLHIAVVERKIRGVTGENGDTLFESVLKTILSSTSYTHNWYPEAEVEIVTEQWNFKNTYDTDEIRVIAFVQDEATKEVYQAMIDRFDMSTALGDNQVFHRASENTGFILYPNPTCHEIYIKFNKAPGSKAKAELFDINGKLVLTKELNQGLTLYEVSIKDYPEGFYLMRITSDKRFLGLQKLIIRR